jgi:hypothetical protein
LLAPLTGAYIGYRRRPLYFAVLHLLPALLLITLNGLRVQNCDFWEGLTFFLLMPVPSALLAAAAFRWLGRWGLLALALSMAASLWQLYAEPPIFVYDHFWGHFAGSLYDEGITPSRTLILWRAVTLAMCGALALTGRRRVWWVGMLLCAEPWLAERIGYRVDRADIERELSTRIEIPGLVLHLPPGVANADAIQRDHAFRLHQLRTSLAITDAPAIHSYVYRDELMKARLMGGRNTMIAKPWLREIHIHGPADEHDVMPHELVHALAGTFTDTLLAVPSRWGIDVRMALVEGLAEAFSPPRGDLDLHTYARALQAVGLAPDLPRILGLGGFWTQAPRRAYTVAGSFIRFLYHREGIARLRDLYKDGDFQRAYGEPIEVLVDEWQDYLRALPLAEHDEVLTREQFRTPSIFHKPCAHVIARLQRAARGASPQQAVLLHRQICQHLGDATQARLDLARALYEAGDASGFSELDAALGASESLSGMQRATLAELRGELAWRADQIDAARAAFAEALEAQVSLPSQRLQWVRLWALDQPPTLRLAMRAYFDHTGALPEIDGATARYLRGRNSGDPQLLQTPHPFAPIEAERIRLLARIAQRAGDFEAARTHWRHYAQVIPSSGESARAIDMLARIDFYAAHQ